MTFEIKFYFIQNVRTQCSVSNSKQKRCLRKTRFLYIKLILCDLPSYVILYKICALIFLATLESKNQILINKIFMNKFLHIKVTFNDLGEYITF